MTPAQLLHRLPPPPEVVVGEVVQPEVPLDLIKPEYCSAGVHYTSEAMEEDFSISVDLLMDTPRFLHFLKDADAHYGILSEKAREELANHLATIEDFCGHWLND